LECTRIETELHETAGEIGRTCGELSEQISRIETMSQNAETCAQQGHEHRVDIDKSTRRLDAVEDLQKALEARVEARIAGGGLYVTETMAEMFTTTTPEAAVDRLLRWIKTMELRLQTQNDELAKRVHANASRIDGLTFTLERELRQIELKIEKLGHELRGEHAKLGLRMEATEVRVDAMTGTSIIELKKDLPHALLEVEVEAETGPGGED